VNQTDFIQPCEDGKYWQLDLVRSICVCFVAIDHGNRAFGMWNALDGVSWVLQYLFVISGIAFAMSRSPLTTYLLRLGCYVVFGVCVNWVAWVVTGKNWKSDFASVVFQFWFIVGLMLYAAILHPLKPYCQMVRNRALQEDRTPQRVALPLVISVFGISSISLLGVWIIPRALLWTIKYLIEFSSRSSWASVWELPTTEAEGHAFLQEMSLYVVTPLCSYFIVIVLPVWVRETSWVTWFVIVNVYWTRFCFYRGASDRLFHALDLFMIGMVAQYFGLKGRQVLGDIIHRYWFLVFFMCTWIWFPGSFGRFDEAPLDNLWVRVKVNLVEAVFVVSFLVAAERFVDHRIYTKDRFQWLNAWALLVFLVHKAVHLMMIFPLNWGMFFALAPVCAFFASGAEPVEPPAAGKKVHTGIPLRSRSFHAAEKASVQVLESKIP